MLAFIFLRWWGCGWVYWGHGHFLRVIPLGHIQLCILLGARMHTFLVPLNQALIICKHQWASPLQEEWLYGSSLWVSNIRIGHSYYSGTNSTLFLLSQVRHSLYQTQFLSANLLRSVFIFSECRVASLLMTTKWWWFSVWMGWFVSSDLEGVFHCFSRVFLGNI